MIKVKKEHEFAKIPTRANSSDAGADLYSVENITIPPQSRAVISTGISIDIEYYGVYARIAPRSGLAAKHGIDVLAGVVDSGYRGIIGVVLLNTDKDNSYEIKVGDRIAQLIIENYHCIPFIETETITESARSTDGFGSTGK
jgi:dUTP pyrophosphatase